MLDDKTQIFEQHRASLEGIAYRLLGTLADAADVVQDTYIKWLAADHQNIQNSRAWLITVCSRLAINLMQSARLKRESYVGTWLPEPFIDGVALDSSEQLERDESISVALLLALEKLSPAERAAYLLYEVFSFSFSEIAIVLQKNQASCRQLASRARKRIHENKPRFEASSEEHQNLLNGFLQAAREGKLDQFKTLLANSVELYADGGGKVEAIAEKLCGLDKVSKFFIGIWRGFEHNNIEINTLPHWFNGSPGILIYENKRLATAITLDIHNGYIQRIYAIRNPEKLVSFK